MSDSPWYGTIDEGKPLVQGEVIHSCPILIPKTDSDLTKTDKNVKIIIRRYNVIIMSQSCDLRHDKLDNVLVCPLHEIGKAVKKFPHLKSRKESEALERGYLPAYHLLNECEISGSERDYSIVTFRDVYGVPLNILKKSIQGQQRVELLPPYKEHLSQAFARFFMRVGLPVDIKGFQERLQDM
ncbi:MAG: hypothetical protein GF364_06395 [Candidatus Lokiarchaeota archaeon]|nr:hypothetical protein [Candidatus Lokiarchaeota archaeon]